MITTQGQGTPITVGIVLNDTSYHTIATGDTNKTYRLESLYCGGDATGGNFTLTLNDGTTDYHIEPLRAVSNSAPYHLKDHPLPIPKDWTLKCKASSADHLWVTVVLALVAKAAGG